METVFDADLHLDGVVHVGVVRQGVNSHSELLDDVAEPLDERHTQEISAQDRHVMK